MLNTYEVKTTKNAHETQTMVLEPKTTHRRDPTIQVTNVYHTPVYDTREYSQHSKQAFQPPQQPGTVTITEGDLKARTGTTGDTQPNL